MDKMNIGCFLAFLFMNIVVLSNAQAPERYYDLYIYDVNMTKLCVNTTTLTANGTVPGPTIYANKGERVLVNVHNNGTNVISIHWHGVLQPRNPWYDGPGNVTQCPIQPGTNFTYHLIFSTEEGTLWYHAHSEWSMATVHGAIVVYPPNDQYPYPIIPDGQQEIVLGSWYKQEVMEMFDEVINSTSWQFPGVDSFTINGQPGYPNNCSDNSTFRMTVEYNKTYLLRVVNAVLNENQFFGIAGHKLTLVGHDGSYTKPLTRDYIMITPGQTMDLLFTANQTQGCYSMATTQFDDFGTDITALYATAIVAYQDYCSNTTDPSTLTFPDFPANNDTAEAINFTNSIRSLADQDHPVNVPLDIDKNVLITVAVGVTATGRLAGSLNNVSFVFPQIDVLDAYYSNITGSTGECNMSNVYDDDFPSEPDLMFNFTGDTSGVSSSPVLATKALMFNYSDAVHMVFQGTSFGAETHPLHIHGTTFYVVATGFGNFNESTMTICSNSTNSTEPCYNFVDPPELNTVAVPKGGWAAIRFVANNPGVWFVHCHFERHLTWGMATTFIVKNGEGPFERIGLRPTNMPLCSCNTSSTPSLSSILDEAMNLFSYVTSF